MNAQFVSLVKRTIIRWTKLRVSELTKFYEQTPSLHIRGMRDGDKQTLSTTLVERLFSKTHNDLKNMALLNRIKKTMYLAKYHYFLKLLPPYKYNVNTLLS